MSPLPAVGAEGSARCWGLRSVCSRPAWARVLCTVVVHTAAHRCVREPQPALPQAAGKAFRVMETVFCHSVLFSVSVTENLHGSAENYEQSTNKLPQQKSLY